MRPITKSAAYFLFPFALMPASFAEDEDLVIVDEIIEEEGAPDETKKACDNPWDPRG